MLLRMSTLFLRTLREDPADAEVPSHRLLVRAGYIRRAAPGIYTWLPLGWRVLPQRRARSSARRWTRMGAQEVHFPALLPREPYEATGRWTEYGDNIFRLKDRKGADYLLGPTHEEMFTLLVKDLYSSYKDLPLSIYQIQTKYRDEARPRAGLLRGREFVMKDSYSFDVDDAGLERVLRDAPRGLHPDLRPARARLRHRLARCPGRWAARGSEEFLQPAEVGEDTYVRCTPCDYAANVEAVRHARAARPRCDGVPAAHVEDTPDTPTIETLVALANERFPARGPRLDRRRHAEERRRQAASTPTARASRSPSACPATARSTSSGSRPPSHPPRSSRSPRDFADTPGAGAAATSAPPRSARRARPGSATCSTRASSRAPAGSPAPTSPAGTSSTWSPAATSPATAPSRPPRCARATPARLRRRHRCVIARGIEMGHIFQLGRKYAEALGLKVLDENGKLVTRHDGLVRHRRLAGPSPPIAEATLDENGLCWPRAVAPADVHLVATGKDDAVFAAAETLAGELEAPGSAVLLDDRPGSRPG